MRLSRSRKQLSNFCGLVFLSALVMTCKGRADKSGLASAQNEKIVNLSRVAGTVDMWDIAYPDTGKIKTGQTYYLSWDVRNRLPEEEIDCESMRNKLEPVTFEQMSGADNETYVGFRKRIDPSLLKKCDDQAPEEYSKISLKCQASGDWVGIRRVEGCLFTDSSGSQLAAKGWGTPSSSAGDVEPMEMANKKKFGLDETIPDINVNINYGKVCAQKLGRIPAFDCVKEGQIIPITKDGVEVPFGQHRRGGKCDKPVYLGLGDDGQCVPYARLGRLPSLMPDGTENTDVDTVFICRRYKIGDKDPASDRIVPRKPETGLHEDVAIVQHNRKTGETCWYQALSVFQENDRSLPTWRVPPPYEDDLPQEIVDKNATISDPKQRAMKAKDFWIHPNDSVRFKCITCHDSDPFMYSPYVAQVKVSNTPEGVKQYVLPCDPAKPGQISKNTCAKQDGKGLYSNVSKLHSPPEWPKLYAISPKSSDPAVKECVSCHRIGSLNTCRSWSRDSIGLPGLGSTSLNAKSTTAKKFPLNHWMPLEPGMPATAAGSNHSITSLVAWEAQYKKAADAIANCCTEWNGGTPTAAFNASCTAELTTSTPPSVSGTAVVLTATGPVAIPDNNPTGVNIPLGGNPPANVRIKQIAVKVSIKHPYVGQLKVVLKRQGDADILVYDGDKAQFPATENLNLNVNSTTVPGLGALAGTAAAGNWSLQIIDTRQHEVGQFTSGEVTLTVDPVQ